MTGELYEPLHQPAEEEAELTVALIWEARAVPGRGDELLAWAHDQELTPPPPRRETFRAPQDRVLVITWWDAPYSADLPELPEPEGELVTRPVHRWRFEAVDGAPVGSV